MKSSATTFQIGDVVMLHSGGPCMTVNHIDENFEFIGCIWFTIDGEKRLDNFRPEVIDQFSDPEEDELEEELKGEIEELEEEFSGEELEDEVEEVKEDFSAEEFIRHDPGDEDEDEEDDKEENDDLHQAVIAKRKSRV